MNEPIQMDPNLAINPQPHHINKHLVWTIVGLAALVTLGLAYYVYQSTPSSAEYTPVTQPQSALRESSELSAQIQSFDAGNPDDDLGKIDTELNK